MAFADKIKILDTQESRRIQREYAERFKRLSGFDWPPKTSADWVAVLERAGFSEKRIEQFLHGIGVAGFDDVGELPPVYISTSGDWPIFSARLFEGLEKWKRGESDRTADNSTDKKKNTWKIPTDLDVVRLAKLIKENQNPDHTKKSIAEEFTGGDTKEAGRLLKQLQPSRYGYLLD